MRDVLVLINERNLSDGWLTQAKRSGVGGTRLATHPPARLVSIAYHPPPSPRLPTHPPPRLVSNY